MLKIGDAAIWTRTLDRWGRAESVPVIVVAPRGAWLIVVDPVGVAHRVRPHNLKRQAPASRPTIESMSIACGIEGDHERCQRNRYHGHPGYPCECSCHRPKAQPRILEEW